MIYYILAFKMGSLVPEWMDLLRDTDFEKVKTKAKNLKKEFPQASFGIRQIEETEMEIL